MLISGLTGCGGNDNNQANMYRGSKAQMNYDEGGYSANNPYYGTGVGGKEYYQDNRFSEKNGRMNNARSNYNHDRKTEMVRGMTGNHRSGMVDENGILNRKTDHIQRGMNFKDSTMHKKGTKQSMNYHQDYDGKHVQSLTRDIEKMNGVKNARVMMHKNEVVIGYEEDGKQNDMDNKIHQHVMKSAGEGKHVMVTADKKMYSSMKKMDDRLRSGTAFKEIEHTFTDMMKDLGSAAKRPFEKSR